MSTPVTMTHTGALVSAPAAFPASLFERIQTSFQGVYQGSRAGNPTVIGATDLAPFVIALDSITKVRVLALRIQSGTMKVKVTSSAGTDQAVGVGATGVFLWTSPFPGDEITSIKLVGTGEVSYLIAGDL